MKWACVMVVALAVAVAAADNLKCFECTDCGNQKMEKEVQCGQLFDSCQKLVSGDKISKQCGTKLACDANEAASEAADSFADAFNVNLGSSVDGSMYCCDDDLCNGAPGLPMAPVAALLAPLLAYLLR